MFLTVKNGLIFKGLIKLIVQNKTAQHLGYVLAPKLLYPSRSKSRVKLKSADGKPTQVVTHLHINGREAAIAITPYIEEEMAFE